jgi:hypothetical protein
MIDRSASKRGWAGGGAPLAAILPAAVLLGAFGCPATNSGSHFGTGGAGASAGTATGGHAPAGPTGTGGSVSFFDGGTGSGGASGDGCSEAAKLVYVVGQGNELYSFYPPTLELKEIGLIDCPSGGSTPFSMAVDRSGTAWVLFSDGNIYHVDVTTAACTATTFAPNQQPDFDLFGMGFVADAPGSTSETLYIGSYSGTGIAKIDTQTLQVIPVGNYDTISGAAEITGTGDARLFAFFTGAPVTIAELDKSNGHVLSKAPQPSVSIGSGWAFAFWGGDFWLFTAPLGSSQITQYKPATSMTTVVVPDVGGFTIVGAGVSTCAPIKPPS